MKRVRSRTTQGLNQSGLALATGAILFAFGCGAGQAPPEKTTVDSLQRGVRSETERLLAVAAVLGRTGATDARANLVAALKQAAERRETAMLALMEAAPEVALAGAMPAAERDGLPPEARAHVEKDATETGTLEVLGRLEEDGRVGYERYLVIGERRLRLWIERVSDDYLSGSVLTVRGIALADQIASTEEMVIVREARGNTPVTSNGSGPATRRALVININFSDMPTEPWTIDTAITRFADATSWFLEGSYGQMTIVSDVIGWFTIAAPSTTCSPNTFLTQAQAAARTAGYEPNNYDHVVITFPRASGCGWSGLGQVPGRITWLNNTVSRSVSTHELGHNLGLAHSHSRRCSESPLTGSCSTSEYGDRFDVMGSGGAAHYHGSYRTYLGWIPSSDVSTVTPSTSDVVVTLRSAESASGTRVLRVQRGATNEYFHVEAREAIGYDSVLGTYPLLLNGVAVYLGTTWRDQSIVDIGYTTATVADSPLVFGDTLYDYGGDVSITPLYNIDGDTYVQVHYGLAP